MAQLAENFERIEKTEIVRRKWVIDWCPTRGEIVACMLSGVAVLVLTIGAARQLLNDASSASEAVKAKAAASDQS